MIAQVSPLRRLPTGLDVFDYQLTAEQAKRARIGQLVTMPFKQQSLAGVIIKLLETSPNPATKTISSFLPFSLTAHQVSLATYLANFYHLSLATTLALFVPTVAKRARLADQPLRLEPLPFKLSPITASTSNGWLLYQNWSALLSYLSVLLKQPIKGQTLLVCPELYQQKLIVQLLQSIGLGSQTVWLPSKVQKNNYASAWQTSQTKLFIVGGFQSLWLPFTNLQRSILIEADNLQFHRAEQSPRIHLADILVRWQREYQTDLLITTVSPNVALYQALESLKLPPITLRAKPQPTRTVIDMRAERQVKNFDFLSEEAKTNIETATGPTLLYLNHHGSETLVTCQRCHWLAPCPSCDKALTFDKVTNFLRCLNCGHSLPPIRHCASCGSEQLKLSASGQKKLAREVNNLFPDKKIVIQKKGEPLSILDAQTIVIATNAITSALYHFQHTVMVQADSDLQRPDYQATDQLRRTIFKLQQLSENLLIQTYNPEHYVFATLDSYSEFYRQEMAFRSDFNYPPHVASYKIIFRRAGRSTSRTKKQPASYNEVLTYLRSELTQPDQCLTYPNQLIIRGSISDELIDKLYKKFNNKLIIEINPYQWL